MTKSERTRQHILEKTAPLFNVKGFDGTSLSDLTQATGLTKGALYGNFADKDEIAAAAFRHAMAKVKQMVRRKLAGAGTARQRLYALLDFYARYVNDPPIPGGCPLLNTAIEADDHRVSMRRVVARELMATVSFIQSLLEEGIQAGEFIRNTDSRALAYTLFCCVEGGVMFSRVERSGEAMDLVVGHCKRMLDQISKSYGTKKGSGHRPGSADAAGKFC